MCLTTGKVNGPRRGGGEGYGGRERRNLPAVVSNSGERLRWLWGHDLGKDLEGKERGDSGLYIHGHGQGSNGLNGLQLLSEIEARNGGQFPNGDEDG